MSKPPAFKAAIGLSAPQWEAIATELNRPHGRVSLICDGVRVTVQVERARSTSIMYGLVVYVEDRIEWKHANKPDENTRKFWRCQLIGHPPGFKKKVLSGLGKRDAATVTKQLNLDAKREFFSPMFASFNAFASQLKRTCKSVSIDQICGMSYEEMSFRLASSSPDHAAHMDAP